MGGECSTYRGELRTGFWWGKRPLGRPRRRREDILRWIFSKWVGSMEYIDLFQVRDRWGGALLNAVLKFRVPYNAENFLNG